MLASRLLSVAVSELELVGKDMVKETSDSRMLSQKLRAVSEPGVSWTGPGQSGWIWRGGTSRNPLSRVCRTSRGLERNTAVGSGSGPKVPLQRVWVLTLHIIFKLLVPGVETAGFKTPQPDGSADHVPF